MERMECEEDDPASNFIILPQEARDKIYSGLSQVDMLNLRLASKEINDLFQIKIDDRKPLEVRQYLESPPFHKVEIVHLLKEPQTLPIFSHPHSIQTLKIGIKPQISVENIHRVLSELCSHLKSLHFDLLTNYKDDIFHFTQYNFENLRVFKFDADFHPPLLPLRGCFLEDSNHFRILKNINACCRQLKIIRVFLKSEFDDQVICHEICLQLFSLICKNKGTLEVLKVHWWNVGKTNVPTFRLKESELESLDVTELDEMTQLKELDIEIFRDSGLIPVFFERFTRRIMRNQEGLEILKLKIGPTAEFNFFGVHDTIRQNQGTLKHVYLSLNFCLENPYNFEFFSGCKKLEILNVESSSNEGFCLNRIDNLHKVPETLTHLYIRVSKVSSMKMREWFKQGKFNRLKVVSILTPTFNGHPHTIDIELLKELVCLESILVVHLSKLRLRLGERWDKFAEIAGLLGLHYEEEDFIKNQISLFWHRDDVNEGWENYSNPFQNHHYKKGFRGEGGDEGDEDMIDFYEG